MVNLSVGSVFYRGRLALIFLSLYHKIAATSILWYNKEKSSQKEDTCMKILAVDYGDSRTGLATCDRTEFLTSPITPQITVKARDKVAARVCEVAKEIEAELIVIGLPLNMDGTEGERARKSRKLAKTVETWSGLPVRMWDERQTTCAAADLLDESGTFGAKRKSILDSVSATVILDDYIQWRKEHPGEV
jgi:putative Holliday junction resolvase